MIENLFVSLKNRDANENYTKCLNTNFVENKIKEKKE